MLNMWILYASIYATIIGFFSVFKKKATAKTNTLFVLAFHSTLGFLLLSWTAFFDAFKISSQSFLFLLLKSFIVAFMWIFELIALKKYYISSLQPISSIKVVIGFVAGIIFLVSRLFGGNALVLQLFLLGLWCWIFMMQNTLFNLNLQKAILKTWTLPPMMSSS